MIATIWQATKLMTMVIVRQVWWRWWLPRTLKSTSTTQPVARRRHVERRRWCKYFWHDNQLARTKRGGQGWMHEAAVQQKVKQGGGTRQQVTWQPAGKREANGKRGVRGQEVMEPRWALRCGGRVERTRGGGIDATTIRQTRDFCSGGESDGNGDCDGDGKCRAPISRNLAAAVCIWGSPYANGWGSLKSLHMGIPLCIMKFCAYGD